MREFPDMLPLWGEPCPLKVLPAEKNQVIFDGEQINVFMIPPLNQYRFVNLIAEWYREVCREAAADMVRAWCNIMGVSLTQWKITRAGRSWGSANTALKRINLNLWLAQYPKECLEMVIVHELTHFYEPRHTERFYAILTRYCPNWHQVYEKLRDKPMNRR